ncbi:ABC transporter substrate-binding protein [Pseudoclavibacter sp. AY1F1]|uniref:ABC transporter substrate-binding protein n=1 Tax=Pseudoclavibacter sp. AY1F1 TaxID=2080583 RepID=UPI000CE8CB40|nr:sugar ABC transporter substrate-binding protein [Pseudoclavibacter sp. AY1F1]PPF43375.1 ABC transporter substrate-binding protein [Pseudoclavibacter sp. AY1F1]
MKNAKKIAIAAVVTGTLFAATACSGASGGDDGGSEAASLRYWLWDSNQLPSYEQCIADFTAANPEIDVQIEQVGWNDYFETLTTSLVGGDAPDVITNHASFYPELATSGSLLELDDVDVDLESFRDGLAERWIGEDGKRYGLPKDWDTVATLFNTDYLTEAGYTPEDLNNLDWNPDDGGTWEETIAHLTVDANGVRGDEAGFDKNNVAVYGLGLKAKSGIGAFGQTQWSPYALSNDWSYADQNTFGTEFNYADEKYIETIEWWSGLIEKGYMPGYEAAISGTSIQEAYGAGRYALVTDGSWNAKAYFGMTGVETGIAPLPVGPSGDRAGVMNGLADSVIAGTEHPEASKKLVAYLATADCQDIVAEAAVVFPAVQSSSDKAREAFSDAGIDVSVYYDAFDAGEYVEAPIANNWSSILAIMEPAVEAVLLGQGDENTLKQAADQVNQLFP